MGILEAVKQWIDLLPKDLLLEGKQQEIKIKLFSVFWVLDEDLDLIDDSMIIEVHWKNNLQYFTFSYDWYFIWQIICEIKDDILVIKYFSSINMLNRNYKVDAYYEYTKCKYIESKNKMLWDNDLPKDKILLNIKGVWTYMLYYVLKHLKKVGNKKVFISTDGIEVRKFFDATLSLCKELGIIKSHCIQIWSFQEIPRVEWYLVEL